MLGLEAIHALLRAKSGAVAERPFGPDAVVYKIGGRMFAIVADRRDVRITLKCDPVLAEVLRGEYAAITPGYHTDKRHWITIAQDPDLPDAEVGRLIDHSYDQVRARLGRAARTALLSSDTGRRGVENTPALWEEGTDRAYRKSMERCGRMGQGREEKEPEDG
ncbi:MAG: MmcQ/YjbR family DNA-binding protein [Caulobacteraceae bacterium]